MALTLRKFTVGRRERPKGEGVGLGGCALTFLGRVPVKRQPGEVEHGDEPTVGAECVHEDGAAGHSWWGSRRPQIRPWGPRGGGGLCFPLGKGSPMTGPRHSWGRGQRRPVATAWGGAGSRGQEPHLDSDGRPWCRGAHGLHVVWAVVLGKPSLELLFLAFPRTFSQPRYLTPPSLPWTQGGTCQVPLHLRTWVEPLSHV